MAYNIDEKNFLTDLRLLLSKYHVKLRTEQDHNVPERGFAANFDVLIVLDPKRPDRFKINLNQLCDKWNVTDDNPY